MAEELKELKDTTENLFYLDSMWFNVSGQCSLASLLSHIVGFQGCCREPVPATLPIALVLFGCDVLPSV